MNQELINLLSQIQDAIKNNDLSGYKSLLYLIYQNNHMEGNEEVKGIIDNFIEILFSEKIIIEENNQSHQQQECGCQDKGLTRGKEKPYSREPIDTQVARQFSEIIPATLYPSVNESIRRRFELH